VRSNDQMVQAMKGATRVSFLIERVVRTDG